MRFHLLANSHLDPVWLWDWREGLNEGITTCRTVLRLMDEFPELTYLRGESSVYAHIAQHDPATLERIRAMISQGRWDVIGGTLCQPDTNLPATEVLCRQFTEGLSYFSRTLQTRPTVAWAADSFGHSAGWPEIYSAAGMDAFVFSRPFEKDLPLSGPAFWWQSAGGRRILCWRMPIGWYGSERDEVAGRLDAFRKQAESWKLENVAVFFGLGNHGGGPTRRQINEILQWREKNADVQTEFSTLHGFISALRKESAALPVVKGELNFTLRGCYSSGARFKFAYRKTENLLLAAERTGSAISAALGLPPPELDEAWRALLFNTFHDILPGTCIERAYEDQHAWLGVAFHHAQRAELTALNALAATVDTRVAPPKADMPSAVPVLLWNSQSEPYIGLVEVEAPLDYRPVYQYRNRPAELPIRVTNHAGRTLPVQALEVENHFAPELPWRKRLLVPVSIPALGWQVIRIAWDETAKASRPKSAVRTTGDKTIRNAAIIVTAQPGRKGVAINLDGRPLFGTKGLQVGTFDDPYGSWGDHDGDRAADDISTLRELWTVRQTRILERGPHRAALWVELGAGKSRLDLTFYLENGARSLRIATRLLWNERSARLKLIMAGGDRAEFEVPGGTVTRGACGEVPGGRWVRVCGRRRWVFASDALYNFDMKAGAFRATVVRSTRYAWNGPSGENSEPWRPHLDLGEHKFQFSLGAQEVRPWRLANQLEQPVQVLLTHPHEGQRPPTGSLAKLAAGARLLAIKPALDGAAVILRAQIVGAMNSNLRLEWLGQSIDLGRPPAGSIVSWRLQHTGGAWTAVRVTVAEEKLSEGLVARDAAGGPERHSCAPLASIAV